MITGFLVERTAPIMAIVWWLIISTFWFVSVRRRWGRLVLIYASHPLKKVVAEFTVGEYITDTLELLWEQTHEIGGIAKEGFDDYFEGKTVGYAYSIENLQRFEEARKLCEFGMERGPQDYCYVEDWKTEKEDSSDKYC